MTLPHRHSHLRLIPGGLHFASRSRVSALPPKLDGTDVVPDEHLEADPDLQDIIACWPSLSASRRETVMQVAGFLPLEQRLEAQARCNRETLKLYVRRVGERAP